MFKLYFNYNGWEKVGLYYNENDVIKDMKIIANKYNKHIEDISCVELKRLILKGKKL